MRKFHSTTDRPTIKETQHGEWYIVFELNEGVGIREVDKGEREAAIMFPKGTHESEVKRVRDLLYREGMKIVYTE